MATAQTKYQFNYNPHQRLIHEISTQHHGQYPLEVLLEMLLMVTKTTLLLVKPIGIFTQEIANLQIMMYYLKIQAHNK